MYLDPFFFNDIVLMPTGRLRPIMLTSSIRMCFALLMVWWSLSRDPKIMSVQVIGNGDHSNYSLPPSYNKEMGKYFNWLAERGTQGISSHRCWPQEASMATTICTTTNTIENWCAGFLARCDHVPFQIPGDQGPEGRVAVLCGEFHQERL